MRFRHFLTLALLVALTNPISGRDKRDESHGLVADLSASESLVLRIVHEIAGDSIIRGTYVYEKEQSLSGALPAQSSQYFGSWSGPGHSFYKVLTRVLAPRHFEHSSDMGAITVRYVVESVNGEHTRVRIDAVFIESGRHRVDPSDGSVEMAELKAIQDSLNKAHLAEQQSAEARAAREKDEVARQVLTGKHNEELERLTSAQRSVTALERSVNDLRRETEMRVIDSGGQLLSAPFHSAPVLQDLSVGTELLVVIVTPYWYGVETTAGQHGWVHHKQLEPLP